MSFFAGFIVLGKTDENTESTQKIISLLEALTTHPVYINYQLQESNGLQQVAFFTNLISVRLHYPEFGTVVKRDSEWEKTVFEPQLEQFFQQVQVYNPQALGVAYLKHEHQDTDMACVWSFSPSRPFSKRGDPFLSPMSEQSTFFWDKLGKEYSMYW